MVEPLFWHQEQSPQQRPDLELLDFSKTDDLMPTVIQHELSGQVLMLGYMSKESLKVTLEGDKVCFYSRSKKRLWVKGESSKHYLYWVSIVADCDRDALTISARPQGPTCHLGTPSCFHAPLLPPPSILHALEQLIASRAHTPHPSTAPSYTQLLLSEGLLKIAQKVGEEATELVIAATAQSDERIIAETADLMYHLLVLLHKKNLSWDQVLEELASRKKIKMDENRTKIAKMQQKKASKKS